MSILQLDFEISHNDSHGTIVYFPTFNYVDFMVHVGIYR